MKSYIVRHKNALYHECGFSCDNAIFIRLDENNAFFLTDARYTTEARENIKNAEVLDAGRDLVKQARNLIRKLKIKSLLFDPKDFNLYQFEAISKNLKTRFVRVENLSQKRRIIKSAGEIEIIQKAANEGAGAFEKFCAFVADKGIGMSEEELFFNAELIFKNSGKLSLSFPPIVAINENAAKPHALPSKKILHEGDLLLLDAGVKYRRYCSDRTRTAQVGRDFNFSKEQKFKDTLKQKVYDTVLKAQEAAIKAVKIGVRACDIDKAAREIIDKAGFAKHFIHSTGHGVGLDIHELPIISATSQSLIEEGMVFTIEPGIYLEGEFGVRIEDMIVVQEGRARIL